MIARAGRGIVASALFAAAGVLAARAGFDEDFTGATLRVDYHHIGTSTEEHLALDRVRVEGPWAGSRTRLLDTTDLGEYLVEVADRATHTVMYTRGFGAIFDEWQTTGEALGGAWRAMPAAVRVPEPRRPIELRIRKRAADQSFRELWSAVIDPASRFVDRAPVPAGASWAIRDSGPVASKVDLLVLGDGYARADEAAFRADAERLVTALFTYEPFAGRRADFNVRAAFAPSERPGVTRPRSAQFQDTPLRTRYNTFDSERYVLTLDDRAWRDVAAVAPYEFVLMLVNERQYGGGGIFNLYSTASARSSYADYLVVHEFGHHFAGLADEYYTSPTAYEGLTATSEEPWEPNVTALADPARLKWADLVAGGTPLPTPWDKAAFEKRSLEFQARRRELRERGAPEEELERLYDEERAWAEARLGAEKLAGRVGAFEGAMYRAAGLYRPTVDCIMFTRDRVGFCPVCRRTIERVIDLYARP